MAKTIPPPTAGKLPVKKAVNKEAAEDAASGSGPKGPPSAAPVASIAATSTAGEMEIESVQAPHAAAPGKGGKEGKGKGKQKLTGGNKEISALVHNMGKLLLAHDNWIAELEAVSYTTFLLPKDSPVGGAGKEAGQTYAAKVRDSSPQELKDLDLAPPHVYVFWQ